MLTFVWSLIFYVLFLGAKAPLGPLQFVKVKVKDKPKSSKIEGCCWICKNTVFIARNSNKLYAKGQGVFKFVSYGCSKGGPRVFQGYFMGVLWDFFYVSGGVFIY